LPGYKPTTKGHPRMIKEAAKLILESKQPILYVGGGVLKARAAEALRELAELMNIPVVTTLMARGAFPDKHPLCLGMPGMHGTATAVTAMQRADLLIALGSRFDDRVTGKVSTFAPDAKIIHVDIDPAEQGKVRKPDVPIVGDCRLVIEEMIVALRDLMAGGTKQADISAWRSRVNGWKNFAMLHLKAQFWCLALGNTRCGQASFGTSTNHIHGLTLVVSARWVSQCLQQLAQKLVVQTKQFGQLTATVVSR
jgi:acetolactate synthase-1/2/3 large subunit